MEYYMSTIDRLALIRAAAEKLSAPTFKQKVQKKTRKIARNARAGRKSKESVDAFDEAAMYDDERAVRKIFKDSGVVDTFAHTTRYDNEWN
jgi:hypothetical protein